MFLQGLFFHLGLLACLGVIVHGSRAQMCCPGFQVKVFNQVGSAFVQVNGFRVHHPVRAEQVNLADGFPSLSVGADQCDVIRGGISEGDTCGRVLIGHPEKALSLLVQLSALGQQGQEGCQLFRRDGPKTFAR